jgi:hypothetical protein
MQSRATTIVSAPGTVSPGGGVAVSAQAAPGSTCSISTGALGAGMGMALSTRQADGSGRVSWSWTVPDVPPGQYTVTVNCGGSTASTPVTVRG